MDYLSKLSNNDNLIKKRLTLQELSKTTLLQQKEVGQRELLQVMEEQTARWQQQLKEQVRKVQQS